MFQYRAKHVICVVENTAPPVDIAYIDIRFDGASIDQLINQYCDNTKEPRAIHLFTGLDDIVNTFYKMANEQSSSRSSACVYEFMNAHQQYKRDIKNIIQEHDRNLRIQMIQEQVLS